MSLIYPKIPIRVYIVLLLPNNELVTFLLMKFTNTVTLKITDNAGADSTMDELDLSCILQAEGSQPALEVVYSLPSRLEKYEYVQPSKSFHLLFLCVYVCV